MTPRSAACALLTGFLLLSGVARAATITVTTNADGGAGSLRDAIAQANSVADTILFSPGLAPIVLVTPLSITSQLIIDGGSYGSVVISGNNTTRIFVSVNAPITLRNLKLINGRAFGGAGGAPGGGGGLGAGGCVFVQGGSATLDTIGFQGCTVVGGAGAPPATLNFAGGGGGGGAMLANGAASSGNSGGGGGAGSPTGSGGPGGATNVFGFAGSGGSGSFGGGGGGGGYGGTTGVGGSGGNGGPGGGAGAPGTPSGLGGSVPGAPGVLGGVASFVNSGIGGGGGGGGAAGPAVFANDAAIVYISSGNVLSTATPGPGAGGGGPGSAAAGGAFQFGSSTATGSLVDGSLPPMATTGLASGITATSATVAGQVNDGGSLTGMSFEYGTTAGYGQTVPGAPPTKAATIPAGSTASVSAQLTSLSCATAYHYRLRAMNSVGTVYGADATFNTPLCMQTVTFGTAPTIALGGWGTVGATASSGLAVSYSSDTPSTCSVAAASGVVTAVAGGTCTVRATQPGNATYAAAQATQSFAIASPPRLANISTRMQVLTGNDVMIGGFVIVGSGTKTVVVRARGPSLVPFGITNALANPTMRLVRSSDQATIATNDDWGSATNAAAVTASGFAPDNQFESAILTTLQPGAYTAIVSGVNNGTGVGIVEVFEVDHPETPLANISTRGQVLTGNDVMIGGFIIQGDSPQTVVIRARGPSLIPFGISNALVNPVLQLFSGPTLLATNDNWGDAPNAAAISASGFVPDNPLESAIMVTLPPGAYTAIVTGASGGTGVGIIEVFAY